MKLGCLINLLTFAGLVLIYHHWLAPMVDPPAVWWIPAVLAVLTGLALAAIYNAWLLERSVRAVRRAQAEVPPADGKCEAVEGELIPLGELLTAPFSGRECVLYEYEIARTETRSSGKNRTSTYRYVDFSGMAMVPCAVQTSSGSVRLYGFPDLSAIKNSTDFEAGYRRRAREFVRHTDWQDFSGMRTLSGFRQVMEAYSSTEETLAHNWRMVNPEKCPWLPVPNVVVAGEESAEEPPERATSYTPELNEKRFGPHERVVAIGPYLSSCEGLVTQKDDDSGRIRLYRGDLAAAAKELGASWKRHFWGGVIALLVIHAAIYAGLWRYRTFEGTQKEWRKHMAEAVRKGDLQQIDKWLDRGVDVNGRLDDSGETFLLASRDPLVTERLIERGADVNQADAEGMTPLMHAARHGQGDAVRMLIAARADLDRVNSRYHTTALILALDGENFECVDLLRAAGAHDDTVTEGTGQRLNSDSEPFQVCREYMRAIYAEQPERLRELSTLDRPATFMDVDWNLWRATRPAEPELVQGFVRGEHATIALTGPSETGRPASWFLQLKREKGKWRVAHERWVTGEFRF